MRVMAALIVVFLTACDVFAPAYSAQDDQRATAAYEELSELLAKAELGAFSSRSSFSDQIDVYASIVSKFETLKISIQVRTSGALNRPSATAVDLMLDVIGDCVEQVKTLSTLHKGFGIAPESVATVSVRVACDAAVRSVAARRPTT